MEHELSKKGFTLLEMIISISIMALVAAAASVLFNQSVVAYRYSTDKITVAQEAALAMKWMVYDIELATDITTSGGSSLTILDNATPAPNTIYYHLVGNQIQRNFNGTDHLLAENVTGLTFKYYGLTNNTVYSDPVGTGNKGNLKAIEIDIVTLRNNQEFRLNSVARYKAL